MFDLRSFWIVFIHIVRGRPGGFLQFSEGEAVMILLASVSSGIFAIWPNRRRAWTIADRRGCPVVTLAVSEHILDQFVNKFVVRFASVCADKQCRDMDVNLFYV